MVAYLALQSFVSDEAQYRKYVEAVNPLLARFGAKLVARRASIEVLEGEHDQRPVSILAFPDMEAIHAFWSSPDYAAIKKLREGAATLNVWAFPGL
jgi:uncharacterized protein (DUF1330 family)